MSEESAAISVPIEWHIPDGLRNVYADELLVQRRKHDYVISFFESMPPIIVGPPEERRRQAMELKAVRATCVARVVVAKDALPAFVEALQHNMSRQEDLGTSGE